MDSPFRQTYHDYMRTKIRNLSDSSKSSNLSRQQSNRNNTNKITMDVIEDETTDAGDSDLDDNNFPEISSPRINSIASSETGDENDISIA
jgi:hypothetical protein